MFSKLNSESDKTAISTKSSAALSTQLFFLIVFAIPNFLLNEFRNKNSEFSRINQVFMAQFNEWKINLFLCLDKARKVFEYFVILKFIEYGIFF